MASSTGTLIVGAGPTGLMLANALAHYGVPFSIVDRKPGPSRDSKGLTLNLGTLYGLQPFGLMNTLGARGCRIRRANIYWEGQRFAAVDFSKLKLPVTSLITQPQPDSEQDLIEALSKKGIEVQWNMRLMGIRQFTDSVQANFTSDNGHNASKIFDYAVGCEGKNSVVRDEMGASYSGHDYLKYFVLGDFTAATNLSTDQLYYYVYPDTFFILIPIGDSRWRIVVKYNGDIPEKAVQAEDVTAIVNEHMGTKFIIGDPAWLSRAPFYMRTSNKMRQDRLFIAGDAAHLFSPIGGAGMNTGIQDAINIAWKLALRYKGYANDGIFDAYEAERLEVIQQTAAATDASTQVICGERSGSDLIDKMRPTMRNRDNFRLALPMAYSGLSRRYTRLYSKHNDSALHGARLAGELCFGRQKLLVLLNTFGKPVAPATIIIVVQIDRCINREQRLSLHALATLTTTYPALAPIIALFEADGSGSPRAIPGIACSAVDTKTLTDIGIKPGGLLIIAPDGYIVFSGQLSDASGIEKILLRVFSLNRETRSDMPAHTRHVEQDIVQG